MDAALAWLPYRREHGPRCLALFESNVPDFFGAADRGAFEAFVREPPCPYFVVRAGESLVACGGYYWTEEPGTAQLAWGLVERRAQRHGVGTWLLRRRLALAEAEGAQRIRLHTTPLTAGFYERFGFRVSTVWPDGYGPGIPKLRMERVPISGPISPLR